MIHVFDLSNTFTESFVLYRVLLSRNEVSKLGTALSLSSEILNVADSGCRAHYNEIIQRMDIQFRDLTSRRSVSFKFEPGYTLVDFDDDSAWY